MFGWVSDRIGGIRALALIAFNAAILWIVLLLPLPFHALLVVAGLLGMHGAGAIPSLSRGVADIFGKTSFSRVYGLTTAATLPMTLLGVMGTGAVYRLNGRYLPAIKTVVGCLLIVVPIALATGRNGGSRQTA